jgi:hypothetical protein
VTQRAGRTYWRIRVRSTSELSPSRCKSAQMRSKATSLLCVLLPLIRLHGGGSGTVNDSAERTPGLTIEEGLLTAEECALLIHLAAPLLVESSTAGGSSGVRQSSSAWLPWINSTMMHEIETKIASLVGLPSRYSELYQVSRYLPGQSYGLHVDDDPAGSSNGHFTSASIPALGRIATVLVYLNDVPIGGETVFTHDPADYARGSGGFEQQIDRFAALCDTSLDDENVTRISPRLGTAVAWRTFSNSDPLVFLSNTSHCSCPVGTGGRGTLSGDGHQHDYIWSNSYGAKFVLQKWFMLPTNVGIAPDVPLLDHPSALGYFPIGGADHLLDHILVGDIEDGDCVEAFAEHRCSSNRTSKRSLLTDFGRQDLELAASFIELPNDSSGRPDGYAAEVLTEMQRVTGPLPAIRGVRLRGGLGLRVGVPRRYHPGATEDGVTAGVWLRVMDTVDDMAVHLLSVVAILNEFGITIEIRIQPVDTTHGRLALYWQGELVRSNSTSTILVPLRKWLHVVLAATPSASARGTLWSVSITVHNILMHTIALVDYDPVQIRRYDSGAGDDGDSDTSDESGTHQYKPTLVTVGSHGGTVDIVELRVYRGGLSAGESRAVALAVHVLDPIGSRDLEP